ncbi:SpoIIE family protein phosphatase [Streptomyces sp. NBC_00691]|uniref:SpoIIE family protein phosphatase n=1 Tax=Streptomyces sp. NBC_00691 TaxID=2903671 RepID=UPI002E32E0F7|nr:SpoIIE family protein phosphatase [Streptomyces sp. NBC_00691]
MPSLRKPAGVWEWTNVGHPPPLLLPHDGRAEYLHTPNSVLLGTGTGTGTGVRRGRDRVHLPPGSTLLLHTDGLIESGKHGIDHGLARLRRYAAAAAHHTLGVLCERLIEEVRPSDNNDHVALLCARVPAVQAPDLPDRHPADW